MTDHVKALYRRFRADSPFMLVGENARLALDAARTLDRWEDLENAGYVQIIADNDQDAENDWDCPTHCTRKNKARDREYDAPCSACRAWERDGAYYVQTQYRTDAGDTSDGDEWETADGIGGCVGYKNACSPFENCYVIEMMRAAIDAYDAAVLAGLGTPR